MKVKSEHGVYVAAVALVLGGWNTWENHETAKAQAAQQQIQNAESLNFVQNIPSSWSFQSQDWQIVIENNGQQPIDQIELLYSTTLLGHPTNVSESLPIPLNPCNEEIVRTFSTSFSNVQVQYKEQDGRFWERSQSSTPTQIQGITAGTYINLTPTTIPGCSLG